MPKSTKKYGFIQPEEYENYDIKVQNQNMSRIEEELSKRKEYDPDEMSAEEALRASVKYTDEKIKELIGTAPEALDTIYELAAAIKDNEDLLEVIKKAVEESAKKEELTAHESDGTVHVTEQERKSWNDSNSEKHIHDNKSILDTITEQIITAWNEAVDHITDGTKHVTSKNKELWNTVSDKADADSVPTKVSQLENDSNYLKSVPDEYVTDTEMRQYAQPKGDYLTGESDPTVPAWAKQEKKPSYTASEVGADESGTAEEKAKEALSSAKDYTDNKIADLINGAPETMDTLKEVADAISANETVVKALNESIGTRAKEADLTAHTVNKSNPHDVTKSQVGLSNVPNVSTNDQTPTFTQATVRTNIASGDHLSVLFGKIMRWFTDLKTVAFTASWNDLSDRPTVPSKTSQLENDSGYLTSEDVDTSMNHTHSNKSVLDAITQENLKKLDGIAAGANKTIVDSALSSESTNPVQNKVINSALKGKASTSHGTHVTYDEAEPKANGVASAGKAASVARSDHVHPAQTLTDFGITVTAEQINKIKSAIFFVKK